jgi:hypothetical protein
MSFGSHTIRWPLDELMTAREPDRVHHVHRPALLLLLVPMLTYLQPSLPQIHAATTIIENASIQGAVPLEPTENRQARKALITQKARLLQLQIEPLEIDIQELREGQRRLCTSWLVPVFTVAAGIIGTLIAWWTGRRTRLGAFDVAVVKKRLEKYEPLVEAMTPLAPIPFS